MLKGFYRACKLEFRSMMERKLSLLFYMISPVIIIWLFHTSATALVNWGNYASLNLRMYDLFATDVFSLIVIFTTTQIMVLRIIGDRAPYGTLDRELIAISRIGMFFGKLTANFIFIIFQCLIVFISGFFLFPARNYGSFTIVYLVILLLGMFGLISGIAVSIFSKSKEQAIQFVPFYMLILIIMSGILIPLEQMPDNIENIARIFPLTIGVTALKAITLDGVGVEDVSKGMVMLSAWILGFAVVGMLKFRFEKRI